MKVTASFYLQGRPDSTKRMKVDWSNAKEVRALRTEMEKWLKERHGNSVTLTTAAL